MFIQILLKFCWVTSHNIKDQNLMLYRHFLYSYLVAEVMSEILTDTHIKSCMHTNTHTCIHACTHTGASAHVLIVMIIGVILNWYGALAE
jgi:hypothetical protein